MFPGACFICGTLDLCKHRELGILEHAATITDRLRAPLPKKQLQSESSTRAGTEARKTTERSGL